MKRMEGPSTAPVGVMPRTFGVVLAPPMRAEGGLSRGPSTEAARASGCWTVITLSAPQLQCARSVPSASAISTLAARHAPRSTPSQSLSAAGTQEAGRSRISLWMAATRRASGRPSGRRATRGRITRAPTARKVRTASAAARLSGSRRPSQPAISRATSSQTASPRCRAAASRRAWARSRCGMERRSPCRRAKSSVVQPSRASKSSSSAAARQGPMPPRVTLYR